MNKDVIVRRGINLALLTAIVSGVSVFVNSFGVRRIPDPFVYTTAKNVLVALVIVSFVVIPVKWQQLRSLTKQEWRRLTILGIVGGSVPFLLFFYGLREASAPSAAFMHKTLFIWVAIMAVPLLGERLGKLQIVAFAALILGYVILIGWPAKWALGHAEIFTLGATLLWAVEAVLAKRFLSGRLSSSIAATGRMGIGGIIMLGFLAVTDRGAILADLNGSQWGWILLTSIFLLAYVLSYYAALKAAPATVVTSVLVLGSVITSLLYVMYNGRTYSVQQFTGFVVIIAATAIWIFADRKLVRSQFGIGGQGVA